MLMSPGLAALLFGFARALHPAPAAVVGVVVPRPSAFSWACSSGPSRGRGSRWSVSRPVVPCLRGLASCASGHLAVVLPVRALGLFVAPGAVRAVACLVAFVGTVHQQMHRPPRPRLLSRRRSSGRRAPPRRERLTAVRASAATICILMFRPLGIFRWTADRCF